MKAVNAAANPISSLLYGINSRAEAIYPITSPKMNAQKIATIFAEIIFGITPTSLSKV